MHPPVCVGGPIGANLAGVIVIFDLDGTVWDSAPGIIGSIESTFEWFGLPVPDRSVLSAHVGPPLQLMLAELGIPVEHVDAATLKYRERYVEWGVYEAALYPGITAVLDALAASGIRLATATSKGEGPTLQMIDHFGLGDRFEIVGAASMDTSSVTKTAVLERTLAQLGSPDPDECLMIGDRSYDVTGSAAFGIECVGVLWGYGSEDELRSAGARHIVGRPADLAALVESLAS